MSGRTEAVHRFMRLEQPIREADLPHPRVLEAGKTYKFPFTFAVPQQLLPRACVHKVRHDNVRDAHLQLPPSFGDPSLSGFGTTLLDDLAPEMAKISYLIKVRLTKSSDRETDYTIAESSKKLRIMPTFEEQPPLDIDGKDDEYFHRQEKNIRKGVLKGKLGRLVIEASQPKSFRLPALPPGPSNPPVTTMAKVVLRFDPSDEKCPPPRLGSLNSKLKVCTYYASMPRPMFPNRALMSYDMTQGYISDMLSLSSMCVASVDWRKHEAWENPASRRDSAMSTASTMSTMTINSNNLSATAIPDASRSYRGKSFYTATILVPLSLPTSKNLVPTFHTCLISRVYALHLSISTTGQSLAPTLTLKLPVQISSEGSVSSVERRRASEQAEQAALDADATFEPRNVAPPNGDHIGQGEVSGLMQPPGYYSMFRDSGAMSERRSTSVSVVG